MKFLDMFEPIQKGNFGLTDEAIYRAIQQEGNFIPVYGAYQEHQNPFRFIPEKGRTKYNEPITIFEGEGIILNFDGVSAGRMTYKTNERFALNHHTGFFRVKKEAAHTIVPEYFAIFYQKQLQEASVSSDQKTLTAETIYSLDFDVSLFEVQQEIMTEIKPLLILKENLRLMLEKISASKKKAMVKDYVDYQIKDAPISSVVDCNRGNVGLTEEEIYQKIGCIGQRYQVLSSSTHEETRLGEIPQCQINGEPLRVFEGKEGILVVRNGKAGETFFLEKGFYAITDHAYILSLRADCKWKVSLKWLMIQYRQTFLEYTSSSDNATWNMTGFFKNVRVDIPSYDEQITVVKVYNQLDEAELRILQLIRQIDGLMNRQIASVD